MKIYKRGKLNPGALDRPVPIDKPIERLHRVSLKRLDVTLGFVAEKGEEVLAEYVNSLTQKYQGLAKTDHLAEKAIKLEAVLQDEDEYLPKYPELVRAITNYHFDLLDLPDGQSWEKECEVPQKGMLQSALIPAYRNLEVLADLIGREEAFDLHMRFVTHYSIMRRGDMEEMHQNVEEMIEDRTQETDPPSEWVIHDAVIDKGKYAYKNDNCLWIDSMEELPDSEIKYHVCCYGDYQGAKGWNKSFILTMEHTIAEGDPYCSRVVHDTRVNWKLHHPPKEFWDEFNGT